MGDALDLEFDTSNPQARCACVLLLDTSSSMSGPPIDELNKGLHEFKAAWMDEPLAQARLETCIISFNSAVDVVTGFTDVDNFVPPTLHATGMTHMGSALLRGLEKLEENHGARDGEPRAEEDVQHSLLLRTHGADLPCANESGQEGKRHPSPHGNAVVPQRPTQRT